MAEKIRFVYNVLQYLVELISLFYAIIYWKKICKTDYLKLFPVYIAGSLLVCIPWFFQSLNLPGILIQNIFIPFEFFIFYHFFIKVIQGKISYFVLITLCILFSFSIIIVAALMYSNQSKYKNITFLNNELFPELVVIENIFIVIPILLYYR